MLITSVNKIIYFFSKFNILENGYNIVNTIAYSLIGILVYFLVYFYITFRKIKINIYFIYSVIFFVFIGSILRMITLNYTSIYLLDIPYTTNPLNFGFYLYFPNLFILLLFLFFIVFEFSLFLSKKIKFDFYHILLFFSVFLFLPFFLLFLFNIVNWNLFLLLFFILLFIFGIVYFINLKLLKTIVNKITFFSQITDSIITVFGILFLNNYFSEIHIISKFFISINPFLFILIKLSICLITIYFIDKYIEDISLNYYFKLFIIIIGYSTAIRNLMLISLTFI